MGTIAVGEVVCESRKACESQTSNQQLSKELTSPKSVAFMPSTPEAPNSMSTRNILPKMSPKSSRSLDKYAKLRSNDS